MKTMATKMPRKESIQVGVALGWGQEAWTTYVPVH